MILLWKKSIMKRPKVQIEIKTNFVVETKLTKGTNFKMNLENRYKYDSRIEFKLLYIFCR